ncbi:MAG: RHS repeat-associated core domain-containing protein [Hahellaceae bacterium]|nr:RHS repeat-associated core domain-containing protein [Hahellaceae bacterium]
MLSLTESGKDSEYYVFDSLGSPVNLTTLGGDVTARYQYDAWGHKRLDASTSWNRISFTGHEEDTETGLIYAKARFYDPDTGRFLTQDPWEGDISIAPSLHKYLYAYANPTVYWDRDGKETIHKWQDESGQWNFSDQPQSGSLGTANDTMPQQTPESKAIDVCQQQKNCFALGEEQAKRAAAHRPRKWWGFAERTDC